MDKLVKFLIGTAIAAVVMYIIGIFISIALIIVISLITWVINALRSEWGDWTVLRVTAPLITRKDGQEFFQERTVLTRTNRKTGEIQTQTVTDENIKPVNDATRIEDVIYFSKRLPKLIV